MRRCLLAAVLCLLFLTGCAAPVTPMGGYAFMDSTGAQITAPKQPQTVAVLLSSLADIWVTAGGSVDITVGETVDRGFASKDAILVDEGAGKTINLELLIASEPDFVIYSPEIGGQVQCVEALRAAGIPAAGFKADTLADYLNVLDICTQLTGETDRTKIYGRDVAKRVEDLIAGVYGCAQQPSVLFVRAGSCAKYTKAKTADNHFVCQMLADLGAVNIADSAPILLDGLSVEEVLLADPDFILYTTMGDEENGAAYMESLLSDPVWSTLSAVKKGNVHQLSKELFQYKPNARWDEAYSCLIDLLYGDI